MILNFYGVIEVRWSTIVGFGEEALKWIGKQHGEFVSFIIMNLPFASAFLIGFALGFKKG